MLGDPERDCGSDHHCTVASSPVRADLSVTENNSLLFPQLRGRDPASRGDRYMLVNFEDVPYGIKVEFSLSGHVRLFIAQIDCPSIAPARSDRYINCVERKSSGGAFIPLLKHGRHFVSM